MKISLRILLGYFLILGLTAWFGLRVFVEEVKPGVRATLEDTLVDTAQLLAELVTDDMKNGQLSQSKLIDRLQHFAQRDVDVKANGVRKLALNYRVTITNAQGIVVFDSEQRDLGKDYSQWNDVFLTLRGKYGARSTRADPLDENSTVMHVAAPIYDARKIIGVLTVAKPIATIAPFIERSQNKILRRGAWLLLGSLAIGIGFSFWLSHSLRRLQNYATAVEKGEKIALPNLGQNEIGELGKALEGMRTKLEGKQYVEQLVHTLAHELKSPIAAIQGATELLSEDMPLADRQRFVGNIVEQNQRQKQLIEKLLELIKLEQQQALQQIVSIDCVALLEQVRIDFASRLEQKKLRLVIPNVDGQLRGDVLLLRQALGNLTDNAIDFADEGSEIRFEVELQQGRLSIAIIDVGQAIPAYALSRLFERFFSLPRQNGLRSTGLGLAFVREVAQLHGGSIQLENQVNEDNKNAVRATLILPTEPTLPINSQKAH